MCLIYDVQCTLQNIGVTKNFICNKMLFNPLLNTEGNIFALSKKKNVSPVNVLWVKKIIEDIHSVSRIQIILASNINIIFVF